MSYEHKVIGLRSGPEVESILDSLGAAGWRICAATGGTVILRRRLRKPSEPDLPRADPSRCEIEKANSG